MSLATRRFRRELQPRDGFVLVALTWLVLPAFAALPLLLAIPGLSVTDAYFEAMSGFTATGATVLSGLDDLPLSVNVWRCFMMLVGGLGIIVLAVAILPLLGVGGSAALQGRERRPDEGREAHAAHRRDRARPVDGVLRRARVACFFAYRLAGMSWADAFMHMCSTDGPGRLLVARRRASATGTRPPSRRWRWSSCCWRGISFALYFVAWQQRSLRVLWRNAEVRAFSAVMVGSGALISVYLWLTAPTTATSRRCATPCSTSSRSPPPPATRSHDYAQWPLFAPLLMILLGCFATCAGSTGGGIKMVRMLLLLKQSHRELVRIVHPNVVNPVVMGGRSAMRVMQNVIAYMMIYGATLVALTMLLLFSGLDVVTPSRR